MLQALAKSPTSRTPAASARPEQSPPALQVEAIHEGLAEPIPDDRGQRGRPRPQARAASGVVRSTTAMIEWSVVHQRTGPPRNPIFAKLLRGGAAARPRAQNSRFWR